MRPTERRRQILARLTDKPYVSVQDLQILTEASEATIRRDLRELAQIGAIRRVHGGVERTDEATNRLAGEPFARTRQINVSQKQAIARAAAAMTEPGETIIIDGGSTTYMMCPFLEDKRLQVLTNSLPIIERLLSFSGTRLLVPGGEVFREQNIILSPFEQDGTAECYASTMFMGAQALTAAGLLQADSILIRAERRLMERAQRVVVLADSSKFRRTTGLVSCELSRIHMVITDSKVRDEDVAMLRAANVEVVIAPPEMISDR
jgi:DeoR family ulaG and ulaABCDEF operon transcriptional repressor